MSVPPNKSKQGINVNNDTGIISKDYVWEAWTEVYNKTVDLKAFVKEFANHLLTNPDLPFTDVLGDEKTKDFFEGYASDSEFAKSGPHLTRSKKFFEKHFLFAKYQGFNEVEIKWTAKSKSKFSQFGWVVFKMDLCCRVMKDVEVVVDGNKKIMQKGGWEFRNTLTYYNSYIRDYLWKIPYVQNSPEFQRLMLDNVYFPNLERDFDFVKEKVQPLIWNTIYKHFR